MKRFFERMFIGNSTVTTNVLPKVTYAMLRLKQMRNNYYLHSAYKNGESFFLHKSSLSVASFVFIYASKFIHAMDYVSRLIAGQGKEYLKQLH